MVQCGGSSNSQYNREAVEVIRQKFSYDDDTLETIIDILNGLGSVSLQQLTTTRDILTEPNVLEAIKTDDNIDAEEISRLTQLIINKILEIKNQSYV